MKKKNVISLFLFIAVTFFIFSNSAKDAVDSSEQSGFFVSFIMNNLSFISIDHDNLVTIVRKIAHFSEFFVQGILFSGIFSFKKYFEKIIYVLFTGLFSACIDEFIQLFFEGRSGIVIDIFIDFAGTVFSVIVFSIFIHLYNKKENNIL